MINWDLFTNPEAEQFDRSHTPEENKELVEDWKHYMEINNSWISFYEWKNNVAPKSCRSKMPHGTHEQLCSLTFKRTLRPTLKMPMTNFMDFV